MKDFKATHKKYGECTVISIHDGIATIAVDTESPAADDAEDQSICYGLDYFDVPLAELTAI